MVEHPDFINVRKLAVILALGPFLLLLALFTLDVSLSGVTKSIASQLSCAKANAIEASISPQINCSR